MHRDYLTEGAEQTSLSSLGESLELEVGFGA